MGAEHADWRLSDKTEKPGLARFFFFSFDESVLIFVQLRIRPFPRYTRCAGTRDERFGFAQPAPQISVRAEWREALYRGSGTPLQLMNAFAGMTEQQSCSVTKLA